MKKNYLFMLLILTIATLYGSKSIDIDLSKQRLYAKENGRVIFSSVISSGKEGHRTPTGNFRILEKDKMHISNKYPEPYGGAKMPYMHRLTNGGIAVHAGYVPGYPASHGCIRVPMSTAKRLWAWSHTGMRVRVHGNAANFHYVKRKPKRVKHYAKRVRHYKYKRVVKKRVTHRRVVRKKVYRKHIRYVARAHKRRYVKRYARNYHRGYEVVEIYDGW